MGDNKIDITSSLLESTVDGAKGFLGKLLGASVEEYGLMLADNVKLRRFKNQLNMVNKAKKIVEESGINVKQISIKQLVPLLEYSSLEEDESIQQLWSNLLVNYIDVNQKLESSIFPFLLSQLSSEEINIIKGMYEIFDKRDENFYITSSVSNVIKSNLIRLGIAEKIIIDEKRKTISSSYNNMLKNSIKITALGKSFYESCTIKK